jgi:NADH:ubiquinone oxidoreductase subunit 4 (subunit M)
MPIFFVHLWLPEAHVESRLSDLVILADVLLKPASYYLLRRSLVLTSLVFNFDLDICVSSVM